MVVVAPVAIATNAFIGNVVEFLPEMNYCTNANFYAMMSHKLNISKNNIAITRAISSAFVFNRQVLIVGICHAYTLGQFYRKYWCVDAITLLFIKFGL